MPPAAIGEQNIVVAGIDVEGRLVAVSDTLTVDVTVPAALSNITIYPPVAYVQPCGTVTLAVTGHYDDGVARDLSAQPGLSMTFATGNATRSGASGVVLNAVTDDSVIVSRWRESGGPIRALVPDDSPLRRRNDEHDDPAVHDHTTIMDLDHHHGAAG